MVRWRTILARDEGLEYPARRLLETHPAHAFADARDVPAVEQIADVFSRIVITIEAARAQRDANGAFCSGDQANRPRDLDVPPADNWIDRLRRAEMSSRF
jgi:hypothetical protein